MKKSITYFGFIGFTWLLANMLMLQTARAQDAADEVRAVNDAFYEAFSQRDMVKMEQVWSHEPYVRTIGPSGRGILSGWDAVKENWSGVFETFNPITIAMENADIRVGPQVAWVVGQEIFEGVMEGDKKISTTVFATNVFENVNGQWLMVHHHGTRAAAPE